MKLAILAFSVTMVLTPLIAVAQNGSECTTRCETQFTTCDTAAETALEQCIDRAQNARQKAICAVVFSKLQDACRVTESTCLSNCPAD